MGDPRRIKKKYDKPKHPWRSDRIESERGIARQYGLKRKREIWRMRTILRRIRRQARRLLTARSEQAKREEAELLGSLRRLGLLSEKAALEDVLALETTSILERRLQTLVHKKGLAQTVQQARQFIVHGHISVGGGKVTAPNYLVRKEEEESIQIFEHSPIKVQALSPQEGE
jgi:small subunit ribosomal protein S4